MLHYLRNNPKARPAIIAVGCMLLAACAVFQTGLAPGGKIDRGIKPHHAKHIAEELACTDCHESVEDGSMTFPDHDMCSVCHDIDMDNPTPEDCGFCHSNEEVEILPYKKLVRDEVRFSHAPHASAALECAACHNEPDMTLAPPSGLMPFCMDCHGAKDPKLNECSVCHTEISKDVRPTTHKGVRIAHDSPDIWVKIHGREASMDQAYCAMCHGERQEDCTTCHRTQAPQNHTISWRREHHGLEATWNRETCAVCHEEDSCMKCHQNTEPRSHRRAGWGRPLNTHCANCHYPVTESGCSVCHEEVAHEFALPSPHLFGLYPADCAQCHPAGLPHQAPHLLNSTTHCVVCHN